LVGTAAAFVMLASVSYAATPATPSTILSGTISAISISPSKSIACDAPSQFSSYLPFAGFSSQYYKDSAGVHINFGQPVDYYEYGDGDTNFGGWALLKFTNAPNTAGKVTLDAQPWTYSYDTGNWSPTGPSFVITFSDYTSSSDSNGLTVKFKMTAQGCTLPIAAIYHNFGQ
jgi:hypothetical protein